MGGVAGGIKYIKDGIFFKFSQDPPLGTRFLYGGAEPSPERANKAASNELKGANVYLRQFYHETSLRVAVPVRPPGPSHSLTHSLTHKQQ